VRAPAIADATLSLDENIAAGSAVYNVSDSFTGTDLDRDGAAITYSLTGGNAGGIFAIDPATGAITIAAGQTLDYETAASHTLTVTASDGTLSDTAVITVNVNNLNDNAPNIVDATVSLNENVAAGTAVVNVSDSWLRRNSRASSSAMSCWRYIASCPSLISTGLFDARRAAQSSTAAPNSASGTTLLARPNSTPCSAEIRSPSSIISLTFFRGTLR